MAPTDWLFVVQSCGLTALVTHTSMVLFLVVLTPRAHLSYIAWENWATAIIAVAFMPHGLCHWNRQTEVVYGRPGALFLSSMVSIFVSNILPKTPPPFPRWNGDPSRRGCVVNGQWLEESNKRTPLPHPPGLFFFKAFKHVNFIMQRSDIHRWLGGTTSGPSARASCTASSTTACYKVNLLFFLSRSVGFTSISLAYGQSL